MYGFVYIQSPAGIFLYCSLTFLTWGLSLNPKVTISARLASQQAPRIHLLRPPILGLWRVQPCGTWYSNAELPVCMAKCSYRQPSLLPFLFTFIIIFLDRVLIRSPGIHYADLNLDMILLLLSLLSAGIADVSGLLCSTIPNNSSRHLNLCSHNSVRNLPLLQPKHGKLQVTLTKSLEMKQNYITTVHR